MNRERVPVNVSARHCHLAREHVGVLFGHDLDHTRDLLQPGQWVSGQVVTVVGPRGVFEGVRVLGPPRPKTQVELSMSDCWKIGITAPRAESGDLDLAAPCTLIGPHGSVSIDRAVIMAMRHVHMSDDDAEHFGVHDHGKIMLQVTTLTGVATFDLLVRTGGRLEVHLDTDEANACQLANATGIWLGRRVGMLAA